MYVGVESLLNLEEYFVQIFSLTMKAVEVKYLIQKYINTLNRK